MSTSPILPGTKVQPDSQLDRPQQIPTLPDDALKVIFQIFNNIDNMRDLISCARASKSWMALINSFKWNVRWSSKSMNEKGYLLNCQFAALIKDVFAANSKGDLKQETLFKIADKYAIFLNRLPWMKKEFGVQNPTEIKINIVGQKYESWFENFPQIQRSILQLPAQVFDSSTKLSIESKLEIVKKALLQIQEEIFSVPQLEISEAWGSGEQIVQIFARVLKNDHYFKTNYLTGMREVEEIKEIAVRHPDALPFIMKIILSLPSNIKIDQFENEIASLLAESINLWKSKKENYLETLLEDLLDAMEKNHKLATDITQLLERLCQDPTNRVDPMILTLAYNRIFNKIFLSKDEQKIDVELLFNEIQYPEKLPKKLFSSFLKLIDMLDNRYPMDKPSPVDDFIPFLKKVDSKSLEIKLLQIKQRIRAGNRFDASIDFRAYLESKYKRNFLEIVEKRADLMTASEHRVLSIYQLELNLIEILNCYGNSSWTPAGVTHINPDQLFENYPFMLPFIVNALLKPHKNIQLFPSDEYTLSKLVAFIKKGIDLWTKNDPIPLENALEVLLKRGGNRIFECLDRLDREPKNQIFPILFSYVRAKLYQEYAPSPNPIPRERLEQGVKEAILQLPAQIFNGSYQLSIEHKFGCALGALLQTPKESGVPQSEISEASSPDKRWESGEQILQIFARALKKSPYSKKNDLTSLIQEVLEIKEIAVLNPTALPYMMKIILSLPHNILEKFDNEIVSIFKESINLWSTKEKIYLETLLNNVLDAMEETKYFNICLTQLNYLTQLLERLCRDPINKVDPIIWHGSNLIKNGYHKAIMNLPIFRPIFPEMRLFSLV